MKILVGCLSDIDQSPQSFQSYTNVIYSIENRITGKLYIGQARDLLTRLVWDPKSHLATYHRYSNPYQHLYRALRKYNLQAFDVYILEQVGSSSELSAREVYWISLYGSNGPAGYNMTAGGESADQLNTESAKAARTKTLIDRYGASYSHLNNDQVRQRAHEKSIKTKIERYGCPQGVLADPNNLEKAKLELVAKYGSVAGPLLTEKARNNLKMTLHQKTQSVLLRICNSAESDGVSKFLNKSHFMKYMVPGISDYRKSVILGFFSRAVELGLIDDQHKYLASFFREDWLPIEFRNIKSSTTIENRDGE